MESTASEIFWKLIGEKGGIVPDTKKPIYTKELKPKEASWTRFKAVTGMQGKKLAFVRCASDSISISAQE